MFGQHPIFAYLGLPIILMLCKQVDKFKICPPVKMGCRPNIYEKSAAIPSSISVAAMPIMSIPDKISKCRR